jgi:hypothetical protein
MSCLSNDNIIFYEDGPDHIKESIDVMVTTFSRLIKSYSEKNAKIKHC